LLHLAVVIWVPGCAVAAWWQVTVAMSGNALGWLYAVEWPVFAVLGVIGWWQLIHDDAETLEARRARRKERRAGVPAAESSVPTPQEQVLQAAGPALTADNLAVIHRAEGADDELAAYNAYLSGLAATGRRKSWRDPVGKGGS
jgi:hypothetical protein